MPQLTTLGIHHNLWSEVLIPEDSEGTVMEAQSNAIRSVRRKNFSDIPTGRKEI